MVRKTRKMITVEIHSLVISMIQTDKYTLKEIASNLNLSISPVQGIIKRHKAEVEFKTSSMKLKEAVSARNREFKPKQQLTFNLLSCNSALTFSEL
jgi:hypothetical protein